MKIENTSSGKIIGIGEVSILPGETKEVPEAYETSPILDVYHKQGFAKIIGKPKAVQKAEEKAAADKAAAEKKTAEEAEALRQSRLASLEGINEEDLGKLANELDIHPAECKDQADVLKKVKAALKK